MPSCFLKHSLTFERLWWWRYFKIPLDDAQTPEELFGVVKGILFFYFSSFDQTTRCHNWFGSVL